MVRVRDRLSLVLRCLTPPPLSRPKGPFYSETHRFTLRAILRRFRSRVLRMISAAPPNSPGSQERVMGAKEVVDEGSTVGKSDLAAVSKKEVPSWVDVAQDKKVLKKYDVEVSNKDGLHSVMIPEDAIKSSTPLWEDFVIENFLEDALHIANVHVIVNTIWAFGDKTQKLDVYEMDAKMMRIRITSEKVREKVVRRGMWNIAGVPMVVTKWAPEGEDSMKKMLPLWVHLTNVPMSMYSWEGLSFITSLVGVPDHLHPETLACKNFEEAKVFVKAYLTKELPAKITYNIQGEETTVGFTYPWLPARCTKCGKWGHYDTFCALNKKEKEGEQKGSEHSNMKEKEGSEK